MRAVRSPCLSVPLLGAAMWDIQLPTPAVEDCNLAVLSARAARGVLQILFPRCIPILLSCLRAFRTNITPTLILNYILSPCLYYFCSWMPS